MGVKAIALGATHLAGGMGGAFVLSLARNIAMARLLGPEQFGLAITLLLIITFLDATTDIALDRFLIQSRREADLREQRTAQLMIFLRGAITAMLLFACAPLVARAFGAVDAVPAVMLLALVPLLTGLTHLDQKRFQRHFRFGPEARAVFAGEGICLVVGAWLAFEWKSYEAMTWALIARAATMAALSHLQAERRYGWSFEPIAAREIFRFGWPLMLNGIVIFVSSQIDRMVVAMQLGPRQLGIYSAASTSVSAPGLLATRLTNNLAHPIVVAARDREDQARSIYRALGVVCGLMAALFVAAFGLIGADAVTLLFGQAYRPVPGLISLLAASYGFRLLRVWPTVAALVENDSKSVLYGNLCRLVSVPLTLLALPLGFGVFGIALSLAVGEALATAFAVIRLRRLRPATTSGSGAVLSLTTLAIVLIAFAEFLFHGLGLFWRLAIVAALALAAAGVFWSLLGQPWLQRRKAARMRRPADLGHSPEP